jgi:uncharacterized Zn-binding protein involved in type VI secretion
MSLEYIVVEGYSWEASTTNLPGLPMDSAYSFEDTTSSKVKADNKKVLLTTVITIAGTDASEQFTFAGSGTITGSAQKTKAETMPVVLENDKVDCIVACTNNSTLVVTSGTITVKISQAGQNKVKGS